MFEHFNNLKSVDESTRLAALTAIANESKNAGTSEESVKSFSYCLERLAKGMQSTNLKTRIEFYTALVTLLKVNHSVKLPVVIETIQKALASKDDDTKNERKMAQLARVLSYGAIIRAKEKLLVHPSFINDLKNILNGLVSIAEKKKIFRSLATPFICQILKLLPPGPIDEECITALQPLLERNEKPKSNVDFLKIILTADSRGLTPELATIESVDDIVDILVAGVPADDTEMIQLICQYIKKKDYFEDFWPQFREKIGQYKPQLYCTFITHSVKNGCPLKHILKDEIITLLLSALRAKEDLGKEVKIAAEAAFRLILSWKDVDETSLSKKDRKKIIKRLYKGTPNLLHEYKILSGTIKGQLQCLSTKELGYLYESLVESVNSEGVSTRVQLSALTLISHISQLKAASEELQIESNKLFFHKGLCKNNSPKDPNTSTDANPNISTDADAAAVEGEESTSTKEKNPEATNNDEKDDARNQELIQNQCVNYFLTGIRRNFHVETINGLYDYIIPIAQNKSDETYELLTPLKEEALKLIKKAGKLLKKMTHQNLILITKVAVLHLLSNQEEDIDISESWLEIAKKATESNEANLETILYILDTVVHEDHPFFNYEAIFRGIVMQDQAVPEEVVQALADAIDPGVSDDEADDDDDNDEEEDEEDESDDEKEEDEEGEQDDSKTTTNLKVNGVGKSEDKKVNGEAGEDSDSDETIDMDEASEEDLKRMDSALANIFATKKKMKEQGQKELRTYTRILSLVDILLGRYKEPPISVALMLLMPLVSSLKNNLSVKAKQHILQRTVGTLRRLNKLKKFTGTEEVDEEIISTMAQEIQELMKKKMVPKMVKDVLHRSMTNLLGCGKDKEADNIKNANKKVQTKNDKKGKGNKNAKSPKLNSPTANSTINKVNGESVNIPDTNNLTKSQQKKKNKNKDSTKIVEEKTISNKEVPVKRKASHDGASAKKKAKLLRMQVLSEGLSSID